MRAIDEYLKNDYSHISFMKRWTITQNISKVLGLCEAEINALKYLPLKPSFRSELLKVALIKGAQATTAIEGNTLTEEEIRAIEQGAKLPESRQYLEIEVRNVLNALTQVMEDVAVDGNAQLVTPELIKKFHHFIGKDLGEHLEAVPGQFRSNNVVVGTYRAPDNAYVGELVQWLCNWLKKEFQFERDEAHQFQDAVIESIVAHVYIAWIHPFGDGNGRTARLLEFYLLIRAGVPDICSHVLSNFYNQTRTEYYRQIDLAKQKSDLTEFIEYALKGLHDGLSLVVWDVQQHQLHNAWQNYVYELFKDLPRTTKPKLERLREIVLSMKFFKLYTKEDIQQLKVTIAAMYMNLSPRTVDRDISELLEMDLIEREGGKYKINLSILVKMLPKSRSISG